MTVKLRKDSQIPAYMAYPRFLLTMDISETAKLVGRDGEFDQLVSSVIRRCKREK